LAFPALIFLFKIKFAWTAYVHPLCHAYWMKIQKTLRLQLSRISDFHGAGRIIIAYFSNAHLVGDQNGRHEFIGGTTDDHATAREWGSLFAPAVIFTCTTPPCVKAGI